MVDGLKGDKYSLYLNAFQNVINARKEDESDKQLLKQNIFYLVKIINKKPKPEDYQEAYNDFQLHSALKQMIEQLTPNEFMNVFPVKKDYDGEKYGVKDYFYTMDYINSLERDEPIQNSLMFLAEYHNDEIHALNVNMMMNLSYLRQMQGKPSLAAEWASDNDIETYTKHTDHEGNEFLLDEQGRTQKVNKPRPKHLRVVK